MSLITFFLAFIAMFGLSITAGRRVALISTLIGMLLLVQFLLALFDDYIHSGDHGGGAMFVPIIMFISGIVGLAGAIIFVWGMFRLAPGSRRVVLAVLFIVLPFVGVAGFLWWSHANTADVVASAESIAGDTPYCIDVPSGYMYRQAATLSDFSGTTMRAPHEWGWYGGPHAILAVGGGVHPDTYHWSYGMKSFIKDDYLKLGPIYCLPRPHFARTMPNDRGGPRQTDEFRFDGMRFSVPATYRVRVLGGSLPSIEFYATHPEFAPAPEPRRPGANWSEITVYLEDTDSPYAWLRAKFQKADGEAYGLRRSTGQHANVYFRLAGDKRLSTFIDCPANTSGQIRYCTHVFTSGGWTYVFYHGPKALPDWKAMEDKLVKRMRSFVESPN